MLQRSSLIPLSGLDSSRGFVKDSSEFTQERRHWAQTRRIRIVGDWEVAPRTALSELLRKDVNSIRDFANSQIIAQLDHHLLSGDTTCRWEEILWALKFEVVTPQCMCDFTCLQIISADAYIVLSICVHDVCDTCANPFHVHNLSWQINSIEQSEAISQTIRSLKNGLRSYLEAKC